MRKVFFFLLFAIVLFPMHAQRRVQRDTVRIGGLPMGVTVTNWYCIEGDKCPSFTVFDEDGNKLESSELSGKTFVVSFWISSCGPCRKELGRVGPEIMDIYSPDEFAFIAIGSGESAESAKKFRELSKSTFPLYYDPTGKVFEKFADNGFPKTFVVDSKGIVRMVERGYGEEKFQHLKEVVDKVVRENR